MANDPYEIGYKDGESSAHADWFIQLDDILPADVDGSSPSSVADYIARLDREASLLAYTLSAVRIFPADGDRTVPGVRAWARRHVLAGTDRNVPDEIRQVL